MVININECSLAIYLDCCYAGKMAARLKNNRKSDPAIKLMCSSGPSNKSLDLKKYGGLLICKMWAFYLKDYLLEKEKEKEELK